MPEETCFWKIENQKAYKKNTLFAGEILVPTMLSNYICLMKRSSKDKGLDFDVNLNHLLLFFSILVYGLFSWGPKLNLNQEIISTPNIFAAIFFVCEVLSFLILARYIKRNASSLNASSLNVSFSDFALSLILTILFILFNSDIWSLRLSGDELFHSQSAIEPARVIATNLIESSPLSISTTLVNFELRYLLMFMQFFLILALLAFNIFLLRRKRIIAQVSLFVIFVVICSIAIGYSYKYPSGYIVPQFMISAISFQTLSIRFAQMFTLIFILVLSTRNLRREMGVKKHFLLIFILLQIPVIKFGIFEIDQSVYFAFLAGILLKYFISEQLQQNQNVEKLFIFLSALIFCRTSAILLIPLFVTVIIVRNRGSINFKQLTPLVAVLPIMFVSANDLFRGFFSEKLDNQLSAYTTQENPIIALWVSVFSEFDLISLSILLLSVCYLSWKPETRTLVISYLILFSFVYSIGIPESVRGHNKYALEVFLPILFLGILVFLDNPRLIEKTKNIKSGIALGIAFAIGSIPLFSPSHELEKVLDHWGQEKTLINYPIQTNVERWVLSKGMEKRCKNLGATYGYFNYILDGISYKRLREIESNQLPDPATLDWGKGIKIETDLKIYECLILDSYPAKSEIRVLLHQLGYEVIFKETGSYYKTVTEIWQNTEF